MNKKNIPNFKNRILKIFNNSNNAGTVFIGIYKIVYPFFDDIESIGHDTRINKDLNDFIFESFMELDQKHGIKEPLNTGSGCFLWFNKGFGADESLKPNECILGTYKLKKDV